MEGTNFKELGEDIFRPYRFLRTLAKKSFAPFVKEKHVAGVKLPNSRTIDRRATDTVIYQACSVYERLVLSCGTRHLKGTYAADPF